MALNISIDNFDGPFDLLIHLIKKNKMSIYDIEILKITKQYLDYIESMKSMDLEITSEFIVIAAMLLELKSKELLPKNNLVVEENEITKDMLIAKLIEYRRFKAAASYFSGQAKSFGHMFTKKPEIIVEKKEFDINEVLRGITMLDLYNIYNEAIYAYTNKRNTDKNISEDFFIDKYKIEDKMQHINLISSTTKRINFRRMIDRCENNLEIIVTFLAMLEMVKLKQIKVYQLNNFEEIHIERVEERG